MFPANGTYVVSLLGERNRFPRMSEELRSYVRTEFRADPGIVQGWITEDRGGSATKSLRAAVRIAARAVARAARSLAGATANPGGA